MWRGGAVVLSNQVSVQDLAVDASPRVSYWPWITYYVLNLNFGLELRTMH